MKLGDKNREFVEHYLGLLSFVKWDRIIPHYENGVNKLFSVFGWIEREDSYKDFVIVQFEFSKRKSNVYFTATSSKKYSVKIAEILGIPKEEHSDCVRCESLYLNIKNMIKLDSPQKATFEQGLESMESEFEGDFK